MSSPTPEPASGHPLAVFATRLLDRLDDLTAVVGAAVWGDVRGRAAPGAPRPRGRRDPAGGAAPRGAGRGDRRGATGAEAMASAAEWVAVETRQRRTHAPRRPAPCPLARDPPPHLAAGMASGSVNTDQARVIVRALTGCPPPASRRRPAAARGGRGAPRRPCDGARRQGVGGAGSADLRGRRPRPRRGLRRTALEAQEAAAARKTSFTMHETPTGSSAGRFALPVLHGAILHKAITGLASPVRGDGQVIDPDLPAPCAARIAFTSSSKLFPRDPLPAVAGGDITIVVTMRHDQLLADLDAAGSRPSTTATDIGGRGPAAGLRAPDRARGPRRRLRPARPSRHPTPAHQGPTPGDGPTRRGLHRARVRPTTRLVPKPNHEPPLGHRRPHRRHHGQAPVRPPTYRRIHDPAFHHHTPAPTAPSSSTDASEPPRSTSSHPHVDRRSSPGRRGPDPTPLTQVTPACGVHSPHVERPTLPPARLSTSTMRPL